MPSLLSCPLLVVAIDAIGEGYYALPYTMSGGRIESSLMAKVNALNRRVQKLMENHSDQTVPGSHDVQVAEKLALKRMLAPPGASVENAPFLLTFSPEGKRRAADHCQAATAVVAGG